jgi:hypothetical protein
MMTAVGLRSDGQVDCRVLVGVPERTRPNVALFSPGKLVVYMLETARRPSIFVFRTRDRGGVNAAAVPSVQPGVDLLMQTHSRVGVSRVRNMLLFLEKGTLPPEKLSDEFWSRLGVVLLGRLRGSFDSYLMDLLAHENRRESA